MPDASKLEKIMGDCLFADNEDTNSAILVEGIVNNFGFHPERLESHRAEVEKMLSELPIEFFPETGGGMSFLAACNDKYGRQWGEHRSMEALFALGIALGKVDLLIPKEMWSVFPGGMPYYVVRL